MLADPWRSKPQIPSNESLPDYDQSLRKKDFFPKIFLIPSEVRLDKGKPILMQIRDS